MTVQIRNLTDFRRKAAGESIAAYVFGRIDYVDVFGETNSTRFCYFYDPTRPEREQFIPYDKYNEAT
jgi:hypothetical protein